MILLNNSSDIRSRWMEADFTSAMIVDDLRAPRLISEQAVRALGLSPYFAENGNDALRKLQNNPTSVVITDIEMPNCSGLELLQRLQRSRISRLRKIPVIVVSSLSDRKTISRVRRQRNAFYLPKPISITSLQLTLGVIATSLWLRQRSAG
ncbi:MAG: response regulator [Pirellulaceae bacterium]